MDAWEASSVVCAACAAKHRAEHALREQVRTNASIDSDALAGRYFTVHRRPDSEEDRRV